MNLKLSAHDADFGSSGVDVLWKARLDEGTVIISVQHAVLEDAVKSAGILDLKLSQSHRQLIEHAACEALRKGRRPEPRFERGTKIPKTPVLVLLASDF